MNVSPTNRIGFAAAEIGNHTPIVFHAAGSAPTL